MTDVFRLELHMIPINEFDKKEFMESIVHEVAGYGFKILRYDYKEKIIDTGKDSPFEGIIPKQDMGIIDVRYDDGLDYKFLLAMAQGVLEQHEESGILKSFGVDPKIITIE